jgi:serine protease Do
MLLNKLVSLFLAFILSFSVVTPSNNLINAASTNDLINSQEFIDSFVEPSLIEVSRKSVVTVLVYDQLGNSGGLGSGVIYKRDDNYDYIITNEHVVAAGRVYEIVAYDMQKLAGVVLGLDAVQDIAVIRTPRFRDITIAPLGNSSDLKVGDTIFAIGNPGDINFRGSVSTGIIAGLDRNVSSSGDILERQIHAIQVNLAINPGNSGGPIFNDTGLLMGINTLKLTSDGSATRYEGINFALPINDMHLAAERIVASTLLSNAGAVLQRGVYRRSSLGAATFKSILDLNLYERKRLAIPDNIFQGVFISVVDNVANNPLLINQIEAGTIIVGIDGVRVDNKVELRQEIYKKVIGQSVQLTVLNKINNVYQERSVNTTVVQAR